MSFTKFLSVCTQNFVAVVALGEEKYCLDSKILLSLKSSRDRMMASDDQEEYVIASEAGSPKAASRQADRQAGR